MFTLEEMRSLLQRRPFIPFRLHLSDGGHVEVRSPELVFPGKRFAVVGLLDPGSADTAYDRFIVVWYLHVTRAELLTAGSPPFQPPGGPEQTPSASPA